MNDAYTIGITVALENGVSAGVATIRHDLEELDRVIALTMGDLGKLQTAASGLRIGAAADLARGASLTPKPEPPASTAEMGAPGPVATQPTSPNVTVVQTVAAPTGATMPQPAAPPLPVRHGEGARVEPVRAAPATTPMSTPRTAAAPPPPRTSPVARQATPAAPEPQATIIERVTAAAPTPPAAAPVAMPAARAIEAPISDLRVASDHAAPTLPTPTPTKPAPAALIVAAIAPVPRAAAVAASAMPLQERPRRPEAPVGRPPQAAPRQPMAAAPSDVAVMATRPVEPVQPERHNAAQPNAGMGGGTLHIDGTLLGRWIADHLAHEAGQAPFAQTGFDSRLSRIWPGSFAGR